MVAEFLDWDLKAYRGRNVIPEFYSDGICTPTSSMLLFCFAVMNVDPPESSKSSLQPTSINVRGVYLFHPHDDDDYEMFVLKPGEVSSSSLVDKYPVLRTNIGFVSSKIELYSNVEGRVIASSKRGKRFTGKSSIDITVEGETVSVDRESRWGTANRLFDLYNGTHCRTVIEGKDVSILDASTGRVLAAYSNSTRSSKKDGVLSLFAVGLERDSVTLIFMVVLVVSGGS